MHGIKKMNGLMDVMHDRVNVARRMTGFTDE